MSIPTKIFLFAVPENESANGLFGIELIMAGVVSMSAKSL